MAKERQVQELPQAKLLQKTSGMQQKSSFGMQRQSSGAGEGHGREAGSPGGERGIEGCKRSESRV